MKVTHLDELITQEWIKHWVQVEGNGSDILCFRSVTKYPKAPCADELILINQGTINSYRAIDAPLPLSLEVIGVCPTRHYLVFVICSRTDCGVFWRSVAVVKYKLLVAQNKLWRQFLRLMYLSGMSAYAPPGEEFEWKHILFDWQLMLHIFYASASAGWATASLLSGDFVNTLFWLVLATQGVVLAGYRRNQLIEMRDRETREAALLNDLCRQGIRSTAYEFSLYASGAISLQEVIDQYRYRHPRSNVPENGEMFTDADVATIRQVLENAVSAAGFPGRYLFGVDDISENMTTNINPCHYYSKNEHLHCAAYPDHPAQGLCNENCPGFQPKRE